MVEALDALVAGPAVLRVLLHLQLAYLTEIFVRVFALEGKALLFQILLDFDYFILWINHRGPNSKIKNEEEA